MHIAFGLEPCYVCFINSSPTAPHACVSLKRSLLMIILTVQLILSSSKACFISVSTNNLSNLEIRWATVSFPGFLLEPVLLKSLPLAVCCLLVYWLSISQQSHTSLKLLVRCNLIYIIELLLICWFNINYFWYHNLGQ